MHKGLHITSYFWDISQLLFPIFLGVTGNSWLDPIKLGVSFKALYKVYLQTKNQNNQACHF